MPGDNTENTDKTTKYVLAIDLGTGGPKAALVSDKGEVISSANELVETHLLPQDGAEQDPDDWWNGSMKAAGQVIRQAGIPPEKIVAVSCDSQYSVVVPVDENGTHLMRAVHWWDNRGARYCRAVRKGFPSIQGFGVRKLRKWIKLSGLAPMGGGISLGHILFIKNERPEIYEKTRGFLEPVDYLTSRLTGRVTASQQTMPMMMVVSNEKWGTMEYNDELLKLAGLERDKFPELVKNDDIIGPLKPDVARELGLLPSTPVTTGLWDTHGNALGAGAADDFEPVIYVGSSLVFTFHLPYKKTNVFRNLTTTPCPLESKYMLMGELGLGGKCVEHYLRNIVFSEGEYGSESMPENAYQQFNDLAGEAPAGSGGTLYLPWLNGTFFPRSSSDVRGGFFNISLKTTQAHLSRAVMEGLAYQTRWARGPVEKFCGKKFDHFRFIGGGAMSDTWSQVFADVMGVPIMQIDDPRNATVRGTAFVGFHILGLRKPEELSGLVKVKKIYEPNPSNFSVYDKMFDQYREFFKKNRPIFRAINAT